MNVEKNEKNSLKTSLLAETEANHRVTEIPFRDGHAIEGLYED